MSRKVFLGRAATSSRLQAERTTRSFALLEPATSSPKPDPSAKSSARLLPKALHVDIAQSKELLRDEGLWPRAEMEGTAKHHKAPRQNWQASYDHTHSLCVQEHDKQEQAIFVKMDGKRHRLTLIYSTLLHVLLRHSNDQRCFLKRYRHPLLNGQLLSSSNDGLRIEPQLIELYG